MQHFSKIAVVLILILTLFDCSNSLEPVTDSTTFQFTVGQQSQIRIEIENNYNTVIQTLEDRMYNPGTYSLVWQPDDSVLAGIYFLKLYRDDVLSSSTQIALFGRNQ